MLGDKQPNASSDKVGDRLIANPKEARVVASKILSKKRHVTARKKRSAGRSLNSSSSASISTSTEVKKVTPVVLCIPLLPQKVHFILAHVGYMSNDSFDFYFRFRFAR
jgi:hypothetical protein